ncbi:MAG: hypothetical protein WCJ26_13920 [bacterium]
MNAIEFVNRYEQYLDEIRLVIRPELFPQLDELAQIDPHDLITPETWFPNGSAARGYVWGSFLNLLKEAQE